ASPGRPTAPAGHPTSPADVPRPRRPGRLPPEPALPQLPHPPRHVITNHGYFGLGPNGRPGARRAPGCAMIDPLGILPRLEAGDPSPFLRWKEDELRFAVHPLRRSGASPRSHGVPRRDVACRVHVGMAGVSAGSAG